MDGLPPELLRQILHHLPPSSRRSALLASRRFSIILAKDAFSLLPSSWTRPLPSPSLNPPWPISRRALAPSGRPGAPSRTDCPPRNFLLAMHLALAGHSWSPRPASSIGSETDDESGSGSGSDHDDVGGASITPQSLGSRLGRRDVTEEALRQAMFRYALYLSYLYDGEGEAPQLWVLKADRWPAKARLRRPGQRGLGH